MARSPWVEEGATTLLSPDGGSELEELGAPNLAGHLTPNRAGGRRDTLDCQEPGLKFLSKKTLPQNEHDCDLLHGPGGAGS